jgi:hypothetical protein
LGNQPFQKDAYKFLFGLYRYQHILENYRRKIRYISIQLELEFRDAE